MLYAIIAAIILIADQWVKYWTTVNIVLDTESVPFIPGVLKLVNIHNSGAAFGFMSSADYMRWVFIGIAVVFTIAIIIIIVTKVFPGKFATLCCTFAIAGAIGNCIDRFLFGYVVDMFKVEFINFAVFNVADVFLVLACILFIFYLLFGYNGREEIEENPEEENEDKKAAKKAEKAEKKAERKAKKAAEKEAAAKAVEAPAEENSAVEEAVGVSEIKSPDLVEDETKILNLNFGKKKAEEKTVIEEPVSEPEAVPEIEAEPVEEAIPETVVEEKPEELPEAEEEKPFSLDDIFGEVKAKPAKAPKSGVDYSIDSILDEFK